MTDSKLVQTSTSQAHLLNYITLVGLKTRGNETNTSQTVDTAEQSIFKNKTPRPQHKQDQGQPRQTRVQTGVHACSMTQWHYLGLPARADRVSCYRTRSQAGSLPCVYPPHSRTLVGIVGEQRRGVYATTKRRIGRDKGQSLGSLPTTPR